MLITALKKILLVIPLVLSACTSLHQPNVNKFAPSPFFKKPLCQNKHKLCLEQCCPNLREPLNYQVDHQIYLLNANCTTKFANWVVYQISPDNLGGSKVPRKWRQDPSLPPQCTLSPHDYKQASKLGYDRGHQAPLAHFTAHPDLAKLTNYLSNITPQQAQLNQGAWQKLEATERVLAKKYKTVYVVTGTLYQRKESPLPFASQAHQVPSDFFKVIVIEQNQNYQGIGFIMPQESQRKDTFCKYQVSLHEIEKQLSYSLFPSITKISQDYLANELGCNVK